MSRQYGGLPERLVPLSSHGHLISPYVATLGWRILTEPCRRTWLQTWLVTLSPCHPPTQESLYDQTSASGVSTLWKSSSPACFEAYSEHSSVAILPASPPTCFKTWQLTESRLWVLMAHCDTVAAAHAPAWLHRGLV